MRQLLVFARDFRTPDTLTGFLPPGWRVTAVQETEEALQELHKIEPDLVVLDGNSEEIPSQEFLRLAGERFGFLPPVLLLSKGPLESDEAPKPEGSGIAQILTHPVDEGKLKEALAPFLISQASPAMRLVEIVASALDDTQERMLTFLPGGAPMGLLFSGGFLKTVVHPAFRDLWRARLEKAGYAPPPPRADLLEDLLFLEANLPFEDSALLELKRESVALVLNSVPADAVYRLCERRGVLKSRLLSIPVQPLLPALAERVPEAVLAPLADPAVVVRRRASKDLHSLRLTPQEGFLLYQCEQPVKSSQLIQSAPAGAAQTLKTIFLMLLLGVVETEPDAGFPPQLAVLADNLEKERRAIAIQSAAISNLAESFQSRGVNPQQVLGVSHNAPYELVWEAHQTMQERLASEHLHPEVKQRYAKDLLFLRAKVSEAFLMLQSVHLESRKQEQETASLDRGEAFRSGEAKAKPQEADEQHLREADRLYRFARDLHEQDQTYEALQYLRLALLHHPSLGPARNLMGRILAIGDNARSKHLAEKELLEAVRLDPWEVSYLLDLAEFYVHINLPARCRTYLEQAQKIAPKESRIQEIRAALRQLE